MSMAERTLGTQTWTIECSISKHERRMVVNEISPVLRLVAFSRGIRAYIARYSPRPRLVVSWRYCDVFLLLLRIIWRPRAVIC